MRLSVAVTHDSRRADWLPYTLERLQGADTLRVLEDREHLGSWPNVRRSWSAFDPAADYHLVVEDDLYFCQDFIPGVRAALEALHAAHGAQPVSFYANRAICERAFLEGRSWVKIPDGAWGQASCLPTAMIPEYLRFTEEELDPDTTPQRSYADSRMCLWLVLINRPVFCTVPSLVDHQGAADSLLGHDNSNRVARAFLGTHQSALTVDWSRGLEEPLQGPNGLNSRYMHFLRDPAKWGRRKPSGPVPGPRRQV